jgi:hypothetical protein
LNAHRAFSIVIGVANIGGNFFANIGAFDVNAYSRFANIGGFAIVRL